MPTWWSEPAVQPSCWRNRRAVQQYLPMVFGEGGDLLGTGVRPGGALPAAKEPQPLRGVPEESLARPHRVAVLGSPAGPPRPADGLGLDLVGGDGLARPLGEAQ